MCRSSAEGGRRCIPVAQLAALPLADLAPDATAPAGPVNWGGETPAAIIGQYGKAGQQAVLTLLHVREAEAAATVEFLAALPDGARAEGLKYRIKSPASLARKIDDRMRLRYLSAELAAARCQDVVRYTEVSATADLRPHGQAGPGTGAEPAPAWLGGFGG